MKTVEIVTLVIAIWGAVLSTIAFTCNLLRDVVHRGKVAGTLLFWAMSKGDVLDTDNIYLIYSVTNVGKESIMLTHFGGRMKSNDKDSFVVTPDIGNAPKMLQPGEYVLQCAEMTVFENDITALWTSDSLGREFCISKKRVKQLKLDYKKHKKKTEGQEAEQNSL